MIANTPQTAPVTLKSAYDKMRTGKLLSGVDANPKVKKGEKVSGIHTAILHLAPGAMSGYNVCPHASKGCLSACLHSAGNRSYLPHKTRARIAKTRAFFEHRQTFLSVLEREIMTRQAWAHKRGLSLAVRLNGTSDVNWDMEATDMLHRLSLAGVIMYDYTKDPRQATQPSLRAMVYSRSESNHVRALKMLSKGVSVAVVIDGCGISAHPKPLPATLWGFKVVDGDVHDRTFEHPRGVVIALRAKGEARGDRSGFVVDKQGVPITGTSVALTISLAA
ncbi:hypothetical protein N9878_02275 [bacterium]|nr:hypothetical protein [bacterium]